MSELCTALTVFFDPASTCARQARAVDRIYRCLGRLTRGERVASDVVQTALVRLTRARNRGGQRVFEFEGQAWVYLRRVVKSARQDVTRSLELDAVPTDPPVDPGGSAATMVTGLSRVVCEALRRMRAGELPALFASRRRADYRRHLARGLRLRAAQLEAFILGEPLARLSAADAKASRRAAAALREVYRRDDDEPVRRMIAELAGIDLRRFGRRRSDR